MDKPISGGTVVRRLLGALIALSCGTAALVIAILLIRGVLT
jgi:hypothetical protein